VPRFARVATVVVLVVLGTILGYVAFGSLGVPSAFSIQTEAGSAPFCQEGERMRSVGHVFVDLSAAGSATPEEAVSEYLIVDLQSDDPMFIHTLPIDVTSPTEALIRLPDTDLVLARFTLTITDKGGWVVSSSDGCASAFTKTGTIEEIEQLLDEAGK